MVQSTNSSNFALIRSFKNGKWGEATYTVYDLWEKDEKGEWGVTLGTMSGGMQGVDIASHQTKVWKLVPNSKSSRKRGGHHHPH